jgi:enoyl-CoA hydratase/carnithine racemase
MPVTFEKRDHIGIVTLSRPTARNAWGPDFNEGLQRHLDAMEDDDLTEDKAEGHRAWREKRKPAFRGR